MASTYLTKTFSSEGNRKVWTFSAWIKRSELGTKEIFWSGSASNNYARIGFEGNDSIKIFEVRSGSTSWEIETNAKFRDTNGWYHLVITSNTLSGTSSERTKIMVNNVEQTLSTNSQIPQNDQSTINGGSPHKIGSGYSAGFFDGSMSHIHFTDGTVYAPTAFGEYDANGVWKIKTDVSVTYGTNGFFILKDGNSVTDQSGQGNNWTVGGGTLTNTEDNPSNVFCTLNPLAKPGTANTAGMGNGNTHYNKTSTGVGNNSQANGTLGASSGKYYFELKTNNDTNLLVGVNDINTKYNSDGASLGIPSVASGVGYYYNGSKYINGVETSYGNAWTTNDIVGVAFDLDNNYIYFSKLGTWQNSGDPTSGSSGTGGIALTTNITYTPAVQNFNYNFVSTAYFNFGNGYFGTTAVSSAGTNASGIGIFEYDVPTGYTALSTKGLNL